MKSINLKFPTNSQSYKILFDKEMESIKTIVKNDLKRVFVLTDKNVKTRVLDKFNIKIKSENLFVLEPGEEQKTLSNIEKIWSWLASQKADRKSILINIGGGVITDMGGFAASCFMRGIDFIQVPTTLLSQVDASVGGKTGVDFEGKKNLIGVFSQPKSVIISTKALESLSKRDFNSGFAEIIKHALIADKNYLELIESYLDYKKKGDEIAINILEEIIQKSCEIKAKVVQKDEKESGLRKILNFGHTAGHAIESYSFSTSYPQTHGESIALGIVVESWISHKQGFISEIEFNKIVDLIKKIGLPINFKINIQKVFDLMFWDKKNDNKKIKWVLLEKIGKAGFDLDVEKKLIIEALEKINF